MTQDEKIKFYISQIKEVIPSAKTVLDKKELAIVLNTSSASINRAIASGYGIPEYIKGTKSNGSRVYFPILEIALFMTNQTIKVA
ncbi:MAG: hypothetical protein DRG78_06280 [Epsilonproteobacteria bacterium]|nr:MAG: hypothetical protein DRG78_06280 [Campylobacterota bacterium]